MIGSAAVVLGKIFLGTIIGGRAFFIVVISGADTSDPSEISDACVEVGIATTGGTGKSLEVAASDKVSEVSEVSEVVAAVVAAVVEIGVLALGTNPPTGGNNLFLRGLVLVTVLPAGIGNFIRGKPNLRRCWSSRIKVVLAGSIFFF